MIEAVAVDISTTQGGKRIKGESSLVGKRQGQLTILRLFRRNGTNYFECKCDCGTVFETRALNIYQGTKSCGCLKLQILRTVNIKHGHRSNGSMSPEYLSWRSMIDRCTYPNPKRSPYYLKNNIQVCPEWRNSFERFLADMGPRPSLEHSPDRIDNSKGYFPGNVRWATDEEQRRNKATHRWQARNGGWICAKCGAKTTHKTRRRLRVGPCLTERTSAEMGTEGKKHISASQLGTFERCGEQYRRRYIEHEIIPPGIAQVKGSGVHGGAKHNFRQKKESHEDLPKKDIIEMSVAEFERVVSKQGVFLTREEESIGYNKIIGETKDSVVRLADLFSAEVAPEYQPVYVEESHRLVIPDSPYDLLAVMDLADDLDRVTDLKTAAKSKTQKEVDTSEQLSMYALVFKAITKRLPTEVRLETLVDTKTLKRQPLVSMRDQQDLEVLVARVDTMIKALAKEVFVPAQPNSWVCDPRYCGYFNTCKYVKHG